MRKGILFFLLVAVVAMAVPAGARAPIIGELPAVVIGDNEDQLAGDTSVRVMKFEDIFNLKTTVTWQNGLPDTNKHVYYTTSDVDATPLYLASDDVALIDPMSTVDAAALEAAGTTPTGGEITKSDGSFFWLTLINDAINQAATTPATNAYDANATDNGVAIGSYPALSTGETDSLRTVTLYAVESETLPVDDASLVGKGDFTVYSMAYDDDRFAGREIVYTIDFSPTDQYVPVSASPAWTGITDAPSKQVNPTTGDLEVTCATGNTDIRYGGWQSSGDAFAPLPVIPATGMSGRILEMAAVVGNDDVTDADDCPMFRLFYVAASGGHTGGAQFLTRAVDTGVLTPNTASGAKTFYVYWAVPLDLSEYGDGEGVSTIGSIVTGKPEMGGGTDGRDYYIQFDVIDNPGSGDDSGTVYLSSITVSAVPEPVGAADTIIWPTDIAFTDAANGYIPLTGDPFGKGLSHAAVTAGGLELSGMAVGADPKTGYGYVLTDPAAMTAAGQMTADADRLVRMRIQAASADVNTQSFFRMVSWMKGTNGASGLFMTDQFGPNKAKSWTASLGGPSVMDAPAVPKAAGSEVDTYHYTHTGDNGMGAFVQVQLDAFQANPAPAAWLTVWSPEVDSIMTISEVRLDAFSGRP